MHRSEILAIADHLFGPALARTYMHQTVLLELGGRTMDQAVEDGESVQRAWMALCDEMDVPMKDRWEVPPEVRARRR